MLCTYCVLLARYLDFRQAATLRISYCHILPYWVNFHSILILFKYLKVHHMITLKTFQKDHSAQVLKILWINSQLKDWERKGKINDHISSTFHGDLCLEFHCSPYWKIICRRQYLVRWQSFLVIQKHWE